MSPQYHSPVRRIAARLARGVLIAGIVAGGVVVVDVAVTSVARATGSYVPPAILAASFRTSNAIYHHDLRPNVDAVETSWGPIHYRVSTNSLGFIDGAPRQVSLHPTGRRTLLIGDSFTEGVGIEWPETFAGILARQLGKQGIEVLNAGVVSYTPSIHLRKVHHLIEDVGLEFDTLVVFIDSSDIVNETSDYAIDAAGRVVDGAAIGVDDVVKRFIREHTLALRLVGDFFRQTRYRNERAAGFRAVIDDHRGRWTSDPKMLGEFGREGLDRAAAAMASLRDLCVSHGIAMTVVVYPWPGQIWRHETECVQRVYWRDWARAHDVGFIDCFPVFLDGDRQQTLRANFIRGDIHWSAAGHALIAKTVRAGLGL